MLSAGLARVYSFSDNRTAVAEMLALERAARALGRGIWRDPFYAVRSAETAGDWLGGFELVEGRVHAVGRGGGKEIGRANDGTTVTNAHPVCRLALEKKKK